MSQRELWLGGVKRHRKLMTRRYYYPGHCAAPLDVLASTPSSPFLSQPMDIDSAETLTFWTLTLESPASRARRDMGPPQEEKWRLGVAVLDADEGDKRVKGIRERLYPGEWRAMHQPVH